jgi:hypothetical protein
MTNYHHSPVPGLTRDLSFHRAKRLRQREAPGQARGGVVL